ncbi:CoA transferase subunit A [Aquisediminimonas profunda]|uniref:CoA transferase subunit A n=1 Tax=Aquisediminimonas profunda TaxID=1550733 RepID=UPI001C632681|nr:CoA-transferase [Aquisediminimonas profunda]
MNKIVPLSAIDDLVNDGDSVALGGGWFANHPMAAARQLIRAGRKGLRLISNIGSIDVDLLVAADCVAEVSYAMVSLEAFGFANHLRRALESGRVKAHEMPGLAMLIGLDATGRGMPSLPYLGPFGSDLIDRDPGLMRVKCPFTDKDMISVRAIEPDVALLHVTRCDEEGNAQWLGTIAPDIVMGKAAKRVIITCEKIVDREEIVQTAAATNLPGYYVEAVIEVPFGAHPCSHVPHYAMDAFNIWDYSEIIPGDPRLPAFVAQLRGETEEEYRARVVNSEKAQILRTLVDLGRSVTEVA